MEKVTTTTGTEYNPDINSLNNFARKGTDIEFKSEGSSSNLQKTLQYHKKFLTQNQNYSRIVTGSYTVNRIDDEVNASQSIHPSLQTLFKTTFGLHEVREIDARCDVRETRG